MTGNALMKSAAALAMLTATGCTMTAGATATEAAMCDVWQDSLPTRSRSDTPETQEQIGRAYDVFEAVCQRPVT
jgi:predicted outer membrane protein